MNYYFRPSALKDLKKLSKSVQRRIFAKLDHYTRSHDPLKFAESLKYKEIGNYRYGVGDYRIIFDVTDGSIIILSVGHRREIYK